MHLQPQRRLTRLLTILAPVLALVGCFGDGDGPERITATPLPVNVGVLVDSPISGVTWESSDGTSGITNTAGEFEYTDGAAITFSIGGIVLGTASGAPFISAVELTNSADPSSQAALNQLVFFQSIDADQDPSNGITVSDATRSAAEGQTLDFTAADFGAQVAAVVSAIAPGNAVVSESTALLNFYETYADLGGTDTFSFGFPGFPPVGGGLAFELVFADEFNEGSEIDSSKWNIETGYGPNGDGWGNNEWQLYTDSTDNVRVEDGNLVIQARCDTPPCGVRDGTVTSARVNTKDKFEFRYGRVQARIKPPVGVGSWPAFWSLGASFPDTPWPRAGEIDFMEMSSFFNPEGRTTLFTMHWCPDGSQAPTPCNRIFFTEELELSESLGDDFHLFEAEWTEERVIGKIDGIEYFELDIQPDTMEEFLREFFLILNVAMGGTLGSGPDGAPPSGDEVWPQTMLVDYVRVFQQVGGPTGSDELLIDFEADPTTYAFTNFEGGVSVVVDNPDQSGINTSAQVVQMQKFAADSGALFGGSVLALPGGTFDIEAGVDGTMKVWSERPVQVLLKLEGAEGFGDIEQDIRHGGTGWEELSYDFSSYSGTIDGVSLIFDNGTLGMAGSMPENWTFFYDDIQLVPSEEPLAQIDLPITFDDPTVNYTVIDFGDPVSTLTTLAPDPEDSANTVAFTLKPEGAPEWAGVTMSTEAGLASPIPFTASETTIGVRVYSPAAGIPIRLKADNEVGGDLSVETEVLTTVANQWETLVFDFSNEVDGTPALNPATTYRALSIFFNFGTSGSDAGEQVYYWDDVEFGVQAPDMTPPTLTSLTIASNNADPTLARAGDVVSVTVVADEAIAAPDVTISGEAADNVIGAGSAWVASRTLTGQEGDGAIAISVAFADLAGNAGTPVTDTTDGSSVVLDATAPMVMITGAPATFDDIIPIPLTVQFSEPVAAFDLANIQIANGSADSLMMTDAVTYSLSVTPSGVGDLMVTIAAGAVTDAAGNPNAAAAMVTVVNEVPPGTPVLSLVDISSNNTTSMGLMGFAKEGDVVTLAITSNIDIQEPGVTIAGVAADAVNGGGTDWDATLTLTDTIPEGLLDFEITFTSTDNVDGTPRTTTTNGSSVTYDRTPPTLTVSGVPDLVETLEPLTITFDFGEAVVDFDLGDIAVTGGSADMLDSADDALWTAVITPSGNPGDDLIVAVAADAATDPAGNGNPAAQDAGVLGDLQPFWQLVWSDDFEGGALNTSIWTARNDADCPAPCDATDGSQEYSDANAAVGPATSPVGGPSFGALNITAQSGTPFVSAIVDTKGKQEFTYGRIEIDAIMPGTLGTLPFFKLLPASEDYGPWPQSGEIDLANGPELGVGGSAAVDHALRYGLPEPEDTTTTVSANAPSGIPPNLFPLRYTIEWEAGEIRWYITGAGFNPDPAALDTGTEVHRATQTQDNWYAYYPAASGGEPVTSSGAEPFDQDFYLAIGLAIEGSTAGGTYPQTLIVDEVRVYRCANGDPVTGAGCGTATTEPVTVADPDPYTETLSVYDDGPTTLDYDDPDNMGSTIPGTLIAETFEDGAAVVTSDTAAMDGGDTVWSVGVSLAGGSGGVLIRSAENAGVPGYFDLTGGETAGELLFRMRVNSANGGATLTAKLDSSGNGSGSQVLDFTADGQWANYSVPIADLLADSVMQGTDLDLANITNAFVLEVTGGSVNLDLDDIRIKVACRVDNTCQATPNFRITEVKYSEDFEALDAGMGDSLGNAGWTVFGSVWNAGSDPYFLPVADNPNAPRFGYGPFSAPNGGPAFSAIATGEGGVEQGAQQLSAYNDYNCCDPGGTNEGHFSGTDLVESNVFQEFTLDATDIGSTYTFSFDAKRGNISGGSRAIAFIKTLDPNDNFNTTNFVQIDATSLDANWNRYSVELAIADPALDGQLIQIGFSSVASNFEDSANFYDNIELIKAR